MRKAPQIQTVLQTKFRFEFVDRGNFGYGYGTGNCGYGTVPAYIFQYNTGEILK